MPKLKTTELPFVGNAELAYLLGVSRPRVQQLIAKDDFPVPVALRMGQVWWYADVAAWAEAAGRTLRPLPATWPADDADDGGTRKYTR